MKQILVLGASIFQRKDGTHGARVVVASSPRSPNHRGLAAVELEGLPEVVDTMKVFPAIYELDLDLPVANGFGSRVAQVRPLVVGARLVSPLAPVKEKAQ
ncbi:single-strand DNA binding protein [Thermus phage Zuza8]